MSKINAKPKAHLNPEIIVEDQSVILADEDDKLNNLLFNELQEELQLLMKEILLLALPTPSTKIH